MFGKKKKPEKQTPPSADNNTNQSSQFKSEPVQVDVYTLPEKFLPKTSVDAPKKKNNKLMFILLGVLVLFIASGAGVWFYFKNKSIDTSTAPATSIAPLDEKENKEASDSVKEDSAVLPEPIVYVAKDYQGRDLGTLTLRLSREDADIADQIEISNIKSASDNPKIIGAVYRLIPSGYSLKNKASLTITYFDTDMSSALENSLRIGYEEANGEWRPIENSVLDLNKNEVSLEIMQIPKTRIAIVSNLSQADNSNVSAEGENSEVPEYEVKELKSSLDTDEDKLTDVEEIMYGTELDKPDTDGDGFIDGEELMNFYSPLAAGQTLAEADLFAEYQNDKFGYKLIYPKSWSPTSASEDGTVIIFNSPTSQFFEVVIEAKDPNITSIVDWYTKQLPGLDKEELRRTSVGKDNIEAIYSLDGSTVYFLYKDWVVALSYNLGISQEADYLTTWKTTINSWENLTPVQAEGEEVVNNTTSTPETK